MNNFLVQGANLTAVSKNASAGTERFRFSEVTLRPSSISSKVSIAYLGQFTYSGIGGYDAIGHAIGMMGYAKMDAPGQTASLLIGSEGKAEVLSGTVTTLASVQGGLANVALGASVGTWAGYNARISGNAGTITNAIYFRATQFVGNAPVNVIGFSMPDQTGSATTAAVLGQVNAGTGKYNLCLTGTADNLLAGPLLLNSGKIAFPAVQIADAGANTLDDYEEGTWTPSDVSGAGLVFTSTSATYTKVGDRVSYEMSGVFPVTANGATAQISLPFVASKSTPFPAILVPAVGVCAFAASTAQYVVIRNSATGANQSNANMSGSSFYISGSYKV